MGTTPEQARAQVAATRGRMDSTMDRLEMRLRQEFDPRRRLRRDGPRLAVGVGVVAVVGAAYLLRQRRRRRQEPIAQDWIEAMPEDWRYRLQELLAEAADGSHQGSFRRESKRSRGAAQTLALRAAKMAVPIVINTVAERLASRQPKDSG